MTRPAATTQPAQIARVSAPPPQDGALALVSQGATILRIENETMLATAISRPRDEDKVLRDALAELARVPHLAEKCYYRIPYEDRREGKTTFVEGPSVKAARALARRWGNANVGARILHEDDDGWDLEGVFIDLETNYRIVKPHRVSKWYKPRNQTASVFLSVDRQLQAVMSGAAKAERGAILSGLPMWLVESYYAEARKIAARVIAGDQPVTAVIGTDKVTMVLESFGEWHVTLAELEQFVGLPSVSWTSETLADLRGLYNTLSDGQTTPQEAFGRAAPDQPAVVTPPAPTTVSPDTILKGAAVTGQDGVEPGQTVRQDQPPAAAAPSPDELLAGAIARLDGVSTLEALNAQATSMFGTDGVAKRLDVTRRKRLLKAIADRRATFGSPASA